MNYLSTGAGLQPSTVLIPNPHEKKNSPLHPTFAPFQEQLAGVWMRQDGRHSLRVSVKIPRIPNQKSCKKSGEEVTGASWEGTQRQVFCFVCSKYTQKHFLVGCWTKNRGKILPPKFKMVKIMVPNQTLWTNGWFGGNKPPLFLVQHPLCHGQKSRFFGDGKPPTFNDGILISWGPINPNRDWVDEFIPYYMEMSWEFFLDPIAHFKVDFPEVQRVTSLANHHHLVCPPNFPRNSRDRIKSMVVFLRINGLC